MHNPTIVWATINTVLSYIIWGVIFLYWHELRAVDAIDVLAYRLVSSLLFIIVVMGIMGRLSTAWDYLRTPKIWKISAMAAIIVVCNWMAVVYAGVNGLAFESSLGHFLLPIISIAVGVFILKEKLGLTKSIALALAVLGVINLIGNPGDLVVWVPVVIALAFGGYGYIKKIAPLDSLVGLFIETLVLFVPAVLWLLYFTPNTVGITTFDNYTLWLLIASGPVSVIPLIMFAYGAKHLQLNTMGFLQYIMPTAQFLIAVLVMQQPATVYNLITFALIWLGLMFVVFDMIRNNKHQS